MMLLPYLAPSVLVLALALTLAGTAKADAVLPFSGKIRGVNLGSLFVLEPWMAHVSWESMGCSDTKAERECMAQLGSPQGTSVFQEHWNTWITEDDIKAIKAAGLNTVRIPLGYWIVESIAADDGFATGGFAYLTRLLGWVKSEGLYAMLVLHGAPGAQDPEQPFTGQYVEEAGFYDDAQYAWAYEWAKNITASTHTISEWSNVIAIEAVNEPVQDQSGESIPGLLDTYYPTFLQTVRDTEAQYGISCQTTSSTDLSTVSTAVPSTDASTDASTDPSTGTAPSTVPWTGHGWGSRPQRRTAKTRRQESQNQTCLAVSFMDKDWYSGDPSVYVGNQTQVVYDAHSYIKYSSGVDQTRQGYLNFSCSIDQPSAEPTNEFIYTGEWSLSPLNDNENPEFDTSNSSAVSFYQDFFKAQVLAYERGNGWIFWSWKTELGDYRWSYSEAIDAGVIPQDITDLDLTGIC